LLSRPEIQAGRLVCPLPQTLINDNANYLVMAPGHDTLGKVAAFRDWIVALVQQEEAEFDSAL
jgi:LysR family glycine cleavage system transcriptional activator